MGIGAIIAGAVSAVGTVGGLVGGVKAGKQADKAFDRAGDSYQKGIDQFAGGLAPLQEGYRDAQGNLDQGIGVIDSGYESAFGDLEEGYENAKGSYQGALDQYDKGIAEYGKSVGQSQANYAAAQASASQMIGIGRDAQAQAQGLMDDWEETFGGLQDNLSEYYTNLDPVKFATQNKSNLSDSMAKQLKQFDESMASQGLQTAGMKQQAAKESAFALAQGNAQIDMAAPEQVAQMQQGFLNFGEGQRGSAINLMNSANNLTGSMAQAGASLVNSAGNALASNQANYARAVGGKSALYEGLAGLETRYGDSRANLGTQQGRDLANIYGSKSNLDAQRGRDESNWNSDFARLKAGQSGVDMEQGRQAQDSANGWFGFAGDALGAGLSYGGV